MGLSLNTLLNNWALVSFLLFYHFACEQSGGPCGEFGKYQLSLLKSVLYTYQKPTHIHAFCQILDVCLY